MPGKAGYSIIGDMKQIEEMRWAAVRARDTRESGKFVYAVKTTGIFCRPGCSSRLPKRENTEFFGAAADAVKAGYRPCKRCRPEATPVSEDYTNAVTEACCQIISSTTTVSLDELAKGVNMSPGHFHRLFKKITGITPKEFSSSIQSGRFLNALDEGRGVTEAIYEAGYSSPGRAYEQLKKHTSITPGEYSKGSPGLKIKYSTARCSLGWVAAAATEKGICALLFGDEPSELRDLILERFPKADVKESAPGESEILEKAVSGIDNPVEGSGLPLDIMGTVFQRKVWKALMEIPPGETASYGEVAERIGQPNASRAVAGACAANKVALYIPCHRVIRQNGSHGGYRWGTRRKESLLEREQLDNSNI